VLLLSWSLMGRLGGIPGLAFGLAGASLPWFRSSSAESERLPSSPRSCRSSTPWGLCLVHSLSATESASAAPSRQPTPQRSNSSCPHESRQPALLAGVGRPASTELDRLVDHVEDVAVGILEPHRLELTKRSADVTAAAHRGLALQSARQGRPRVSRSSLPRPRQR
jgi:hypothetical protein